MNDSKGGSLLHKLRQWFDAGEPDPDAPRTTDGADGVDWGRIVPFVAHARRLPVRVLRRLERDRHRGAAWRSTWCACSRSPASTTATSRTARSRPRARRSSSSPCSARRPCSAARSGGPRIIAITTRISDKPEDTHSPVQDGFLWATWAGSCRKRHFRPDLRRVRDLLQFPELRWLDRFDILVPVALALAPAAGRRGAGDASRRRSARPAGRCSSGASSSRRCSATTAPTPSTRCAHGWGSRRYATSDDSRNNCAAGAHHARRRLAQQSPPLPERRAPGLLLVGDSTSPTTCCAVLAALGVIWDLNTVPGRIRDAARGDAPHENRRRRRRHRRPVRGLATLAPRTTSRCSRPQTTSAATPTPSTSTAAAATGRSTPASSSSTTGPIRTSSRC